jgi:hypothetical protein
MAQSVSHAPAVRRIEVMYVLEKESKKCFELNLKTLKVDLKTVNMETNFQHNF